MKTQTAADSTDDWQLGFYFFLECAHFLKQGQRMMSHTDRAQQASKCFDRTKVSFLLELAEF